MSPCKGCRGYGGCGGCVPTSLSHSHLYSGQPWTRSSGHKANTAMEEKRGLRRGEITRRTWEKGDVGGYLRSVILIGSADTERNTNTNV